MHKRLYCAALTGCAAFLLYTGRTAAGTISAARALPLGSTATLTDVVIGSTTDMTQSAANWTFSAQDATGGVNVIASTATVQAMFDGADGLPGTADDIVNGTKVTLTGTTNSFNGLFELGEIPAGLTLDANSGFAGVPAWTDLTVAEMQEGSAVAEAKESMLVRLSNVTFLDVGSFAGQTNYLVTDGSPLSAIVRVPTNFVNLLGQAIPTGAVNVTGVLQQFDTTDPRDGNYQLILRSTFDIVSVPEPAFGLGVGMLVAGFGCRRRSPTEAR